MEPQMHADERRLNEITERIIGCAYRVANELGCGFLEKVYENALYLDLVENGVNARAQHSIVVHYHGKIVGDYIADFLVEESIIVELKAVKAIDDIHRAQCINY